MDPTGGYVDYGFVAEMYDYVAPYAARRDVNFYAEIARETGGPVLEIGCGTGRVLIPVARTGVEIVGLDLSPYMLATCRQRLAGEPDEVRARVTLVQKDMRQFDLGRTFRLVTTPFRPFQHLTTVDDQIACLRSIHRHLEPGGALILDLFNPSLPFLTDGSRFEEWDDGPPFTLPDGRRVQRRSRIVARDYYNQIQDVEMTYYVTHPDGREERLVHRFLMRYLFRFEAEHLLARVGFGVEVIYADFDRSLYGSVYPGELIIVARKEPAP